MDQERVDESSEEEDEEETISSSSPSMRSPSPSQTKDPFCWFCHQMISSAFKSCSSCERSFDWYCLLTRSGPQDEDAKKRTSWLCFECQPDDSDEDFLRQKLTSEEFDNFFKDFLKVRMSSTPEYLHRIEYENYSELIIHPSDFHSMQAKLEDKAYTSSRSFIGDLKWFHHNVSILFDPRLDPRLKPRLDLVEETYYNITSFEDEVTEMGRCVDCVLNFYAAYPEDGFVAPCREPHSIVWAKLNGHPYWPAKAVRVNQKETRVEVLFFGSSRQRAWVNLEECYFYCREPIKSQPKNQKTAQSLKSSLNELSLHLKCLETRFGQKFKPAPHKIHFKPNKLIIHRLLLKETGKKCPEEGRGRSKATEKMGAKVF